MTVQSVENQPVSAAVNDFDFRATMRRTLAEFPALNKTTIFLNTETPRESYGHWKAKLLSTVYGQGSRNSQYLQTAAENDSSYAFQPEFPSPIKTLVFKPNDAMHKTMGQTVPEAQVSRFVFNHELGHLTVSDAHGAWHDGKPYPENAADSFATIKHLQENKDDILLPLVNSWARAYRFVAASNATHMTSFSTEALLAMRHAVDFGGMEGKTLTDFAAAHAKSHSPDPFNIDETMYIFGPYRGWNKLYPLTEETSAQLISLAETALKTDNAFAFHVGLTLFRPFLHPAGVEINGVTFKIDEDQRADMEARFEAKAASYGIPSLIRSWKENVDNLCARQSGEGHDATPAAQQKPLRLSLS
jgi:hypothetical protein